MKPLNLYLLASRPPYNPAGSYEKLLSGRTGTAMREEELTSMALLAQLLKEAGASLAALDGFF